MKKKIIVCVSVILVVIIGLGVGLGIYFGLKKEELPPGSIEFKSYESQGALSWNKEVGLVRSADELKEFCETYDVPEYFYEDKWVFIYDEEYFQDKALILYSAAALDGSISYNTKNVRVESDILYIDIVVLQLVDFQSAPEGSSVRILIEVNQSDVKEVAEIEENIIIKKTKRFPRE